MGKYRSGRLIVLGLVLILLGMTSCAKDTSHNSLAAKYPVIPTPQSISYGKNEIVFGSYVLVGSDFLGESTKLTTFLTEKGVGRDSQGLAIRMVKKPLETFENEEAYNLRVDRDGLLLEAPTAQGAFYAVQTIKQLFRLSKEDAVLPEVSIKDWPAFKIRGFMHDTGRNFQSVNQLKEQLAVLAQYKYNIFHWHLTDDPAWRLESKKYPQLQSPEATSRNKGKFYTQEEFREIVAFCKARHITVIPEFDIPGHTQAFRKAFGLESMADSRVKPILLDLFNELCDLADESELPYIHIGTDEVRNKEEYGAEKTVEAVAALLDSGDRQLIVWREGMDLNFKQQPIHQLWAMHPPKQGSPFIDSRANYINHLDPFAGMVRLFYQQPCRQPKGDSLALGGILCAWPDNRVASERDILRQNPIYPAMVFYSDAIWKGREKAHPEYWAKLPPRESADFDAFRTFEEKVLVHRNLFFQGKEFPYVKQSDMVWRLLGPVHGDLEVFEPTPKSDDFKEEYHKNGNSYAWSQPYTGGTIHLKHFFGFPALTEENEGTFYAYTEIYSPEEREQAFWIGFQAWSRAGGRRGGPFPEQGQWHTTDPKIWVNGKLIDPPQWKQPGLKADTPEIPFVDEDYFYRSPTMVPLKKGWNKVMLKVPHGGNSWKWMFSCIPITVTGQDVREADGLKFRTVEFYKDD